jgi:hypothetical protein
MISNKTGLELVLLFCALAFAWGIVMLICLIRGALEHKKTLRLMKWESWLTAVEDRDIGGDIDFSDKSAEYFLREKFESGCTPYEAIAEWRRRKMEDRAGERRPRGNKPTV